MDETPKEVYRFNDYVYGSAMGGSTVHVILETYQVIRSTPQGLWLDYGGFGHKKFMRSKAKRPFACLTKEEALKSFIARKKAQFFILKSQLDRAESALFLAERMPCAHWDKRTDEPGEACMLTGHDHCPGVDRKAWLECADYEVPPENAR